MRTSPLLTLLLLTLLALLPTIRADATAEAVTPDIPVSPADIEGASKLTAQLPDGFSFSKDDEAKIHKSGEKYQFETEVNKLMKIIINSLYKTKEIFLRELISNASDAIDKIRFLSLTDKSALESNPDLKISIVADKEKKTLTIADTGVGMTKKHLKENLGTIAKSGTSEFLSSLENNKTADTSNLIGQFGVGFYSVFLVGDRVTVITKHNDDKQYIWESTSESDFSIIEDPRGNTLGRGTQIIIHLKDDELEFLETDRLSGLVKKYSEFINFPIYLWTTRTETEEVPIEEEEKPSDKAETENEEVEDVSDKEEAQKPKTKTITKTVADWELMNTNKPIWTRSPKSVNTSEYIDFYKSFARDSSEPITYSHFRAEGDIEFSAILFVPETPVENFLQTVVRNVKLFVRRVFIDEFHDFLPRYLGFIKGLVDADDLPLNVSRETLQHNSLYRAIRKKLIGKALQMINELANKDVEKYKKFYERYSAALKVGAIEDRPNSVKLLKLMRWDSSSGKNFTGLVEYVERMKKGQKQIFFITGESNEVVERSPFVEKLVAKGFEVLYFTDGLDEYLTGNIHTFEGHPLQNVAKPGVQYGDDDDESHKKHEEKYKPLTDYLAKELSEWIQTVRVSKQLTKSPCAVFSSEYGATGHMEKLMQAQSYNRKDDWRTNSFLSFKKIFEINPHHPIIEALLSKIEDGKGDEIRDTAYVLFESTAVASGYTVRKPADFAKKIERVVRENLGVDLESEAEVEVLKVQEKEVEKEDEEGEKKEEEGEEVKAKEEEDVHDEL
ncbi:hypothetical protein HK097_010632 [Rhizophlyctis rosea]|uniref:Histidine kinase/HSP90-like ATPase domain-containing protein n=1 Tax=Rhizophlyctis rosea TaxID=64517 RepID=A0AAD5X327_9FUNG|nr:hypothetical protein HK097_010632 [Rhizophlyctis rosea]